MTLRENAMAIYNREQPDFYGDLMDAIELIPDPVLVGDMCPQDGLEHKDSWGTVYVFKPGAPGPHPRVNHENAVIKDIEHWESQLKVPSLKNLDWAPAKEAAENVNRKEKFAGFLFGGGLFESSIRISSSIMTTGAPNKMYSFLPVSGDRSLSPCSKKFQTSYMNAA